MTIWQWLGRILPWNRENKWPMWAEMAAFIGIEALFVLAAPAVMNIAYADGVYLWAQSRFGQHASLAMSLLAALCGAELCAWRMGLHRVVPFGGNQLRRWTILPVTLWYLAMQAGGALVSERLMSIELPVLTENLYVYPVLHASLYLLCLAAMAAMVAAMRARQTGRAVGLLGLQMLLMAMLFLQSAMYGQLQVRLSMPEMAADAPQTATVYMIGNEEDLPAELQGLFDGDVVRVDDFDEIPDLMFPENDAFTAYEETMAPVWRFGDILGWVQIIPTYFIMKKWLFPAKRREEAETT